MELHIASHHREHRLPDWPAAAISGFLAGAVLMVLELLWMTASNAGPWAVPHRIAGIVMGPEVLQSSAFSLPVVVAALVTHYLLGIAFGMILAAIVAPFHLDSSTGIAILSGAVFGLVLYLFNFYGIERAFPWFADMRGWSTLAAHLAFGIVAAASYRKMARPQNRR